MSDNETCKMTFKWLWWETFGCTDKYRQGSSGQPSTSAFKPNPNDSSFCLQISINIFDINLNHEFQLLKRISQWIIRKGSTHSSPWDSHVFETGKEAFGLGHVRLYLWALLRFWVTATVAQYIQTFSVPVITIVHSLSVFGVDCLQCCAVWSSSLFVALVELWPLWLVFKCKTWNNSNSQIRVRDASMR